MFEDSEKNKVEIEVLKRLLCENEDMQDELLLMCDDKRRERRNFTLSNYYIEII